MDTVRGYLENSSICGLSHISSSKTKIERLFWLIVSLGSAAGAGYFIWEAFDDWAEYPISTITETFPINQAQFPQIIVCPPKVAFTFTLTNIYHYLALQGYLDILQRDTEQFLTGTFLIDQNSSDQ